MSSFIERYTAEIENDCSGQIGTQFFPESEEYGAEDHTVLVHTRYAPRLGALSLETHERNNEQIIDQEIKET